jgi:nucleotide-binding universal stress UspA family protein
VKRASNNDAIVDIILLTAACEKSNMIVVGASGHTGIARFFLGGVAEAVVRHTTDPILVTRPSSGPLQTVIIGVDGSSNAHDAVCFATSQLPVPDNCTFRLVHVISPIWEGAGGPLLFGGPPQPVLVHAARTEKERAQRYVEALAYEAQRYVETLTDEIKGSRNPIEVQVRVGNPVEELLNAAHECNAGLIAVGSHGMSGMARLLLGSVSDHVVRHAPCSVLVVKRPPTGRIPTE